MKVLWICFVWPEPTSSAAGYRTLHLLEALQADGFDVHVASPCQDNDFRGRLETSGFTTAILPPNDSQFDAFVRDLNPEVVFFDRFMIEEQFSWRVRQECPQALRVLDTVDLHSLRRVREEKVAKNETLEMAGNDLTHETALREIAAILRSDLTLIISQFELSLLSDRYALPGALIEECSFFYSEPLLGRSFEERKNFIFIGNFNHPPNVDAVRQLKTRIWPQIRSLLVSHSSNPPELHIFGAYTPQAITQFDSAAAGFRVKGWTEDALSTIGCYRVNLAPLRFGAGLKGKVSDGWAVGTPCIATNVAAEGMMLHGTFGGIIAEDLESFANAAARLYEQKQLWDERRRIGVATVAHRFDRRKNLSHFIELIRERRRNRDALRDQNFMGAMLWHHQFRSSEFFSRWIEAKNAIRGREAQSLTVSAMPLV